MYFTKIKNFKTFLYIKHLPFNSFSKYSTTNLPKSRILTGKLPVSRLEVVIDTREDEAVDAVCFFKNNHSKLSVNKLMTKISI